MDTKKLRQKILDLAIRGKLVPHDPGDEPALELLRRINPRFTPITDDTPFDIPESWEWVKGKQILVPMESTKPQGDFTYVDVDAVNNRTNCIDNPKLLKQENAPSRATRKLHNNDVLFSMVRPYLRNIALVTEDYKEAIASTGFYVLTPTPAILSKYLFYTMLSGYVVDGLNIFMKGDNSPSINNKHIENYLFPLPPLAEQKRIVAKLEELFACMDAIDQGKKALSDAVKCMRSNLLSLAIQGYLVPQDPGDEPALELLRRINPRFTPPQYEDPLPQGWTWCKLGDVGKWQSGATPSRSRKDYYGGDIPWLKTGDLKDGLIEEIPEGITQKALEETSVKLNPIGSVLIAMYGATIGKLGILTFPATTNQACCACSEYKIEQMYLFYFLLANRPNFIAMGGGGAQPNISKEKIVATLIPLPPLAEQRRIVAKLEELFATLDRITATA